MDLPFLEELSQEEGRFKKFRIASAGPARVSGDLDKGFAINIDSTLGEGACCLGEECASLTESDCDGQNGVYMGEGVPCDPNPCSETPTGACCAEDGSCTIETEEDCTDSGGTYQGDDTTCEDVDCTQGACCDGEDCTITTEEECTGVYQGNGTTCDPNPCELPPCNGCGFDAFDGSGRKFLTRTTRYQDSGSSDGTPRTANFTTDATEVATIDPSDCSISYSRSGGSAGADIPVASCSRSLVSSAPGPGPFGTATCQPLNEAFLASHFFGTQSPTCTPCWWVIVCIPATNANETSNTNTATTHDITYSCTGAHSSATASWHVELSDECTPDGMSPPP